MEWIKVDTEEQETLINVDYYNKIIIIYTSRRIVCKKLTKKIGKADDHNYLNGKICGATWIIPFYDRIRIRGALNMNILLMVKNGISCQRKEMLNE